MARNYVVKGKIKENSHYSLYNGRYDNIDVLIKIFNNRTHFTNEHTYNDLLKDTNGIPLIVDINSHDLTIIYEDNYGLYFSDIFKEREIYIDERLKIVKEIVKILDQIHKNGIVHRNINPDTIRYNKTTNKIEIHDFHMGSLIQKERIDSHSVNLSDYDPYYISPEQTGRINRALDYKSDYYSLGIFMFKMFTGETPFNTDSSIDMVHNHIAVKPVNPSVINKDISDTIGKIILKLLEKNAEDRYQTLSGLMSDIDRCIDEHTNKGWISKFEPGANDYNSSFKIKDKLYGRDNEITLLNEKYKNITYGNKEIMFFLGPPGIGKTHLIRESKDSIVKSSGYFIEGKFDQYNRGTPYSAIIQSIKELVTQLLSENDKKLEIIKSKLLEDIGNLGGVLIDFVPEIEFLIGSQPDAVELTPNETLNRFNTALICFIKSVASSLHSLVIFIDDLQWADTSSINLFKLFIEEVSVKKVMLIGAFRDREAEDNTQLKYLISYIKHKKDDIIFKKVVPLDYYSILQLLKETFPSSKSNYEYVANSLFAKTGGNTFFVIKMITKFIEDCVITYSNGFWLWEPDNIKHARVSDDVVDIMCKKISKLSGDNFTFIEIIACIGSRCSIDNIYELQSIFNININGSLAKCISEGLIIKKGDFISFAHDKIYEAAYLLLSQERRDHLHYLIGSYQLNSTNYNDFTILYHLNKCKTHYIENEDFIIKVIQLNVSAAKSSIRTGAYNNGLEHSEYALSLFNNVYWKNQYQLSIKLFTTYAENLILLSRYEKAEAIIDEILGKCSEEDMFSMKLIKLQSFSHLNDARKGIEYGFKIAREYGVKLPEECGKLTMLPLLLSCILRMVIFSDETIIKRGAVKKRGFEESAKVAKLFFYLTSSIFTHKPSLYPLIALKVLDSSLKYGFNEMTTLGVFLFALFLMGHRFYKLGIRFNDLTVKLATIYHNPRMNAFIEFSHISLKCWRNHPEENYKLYMGNIPRAAEVGDQEYRSWNYLYSFDQLLLTGANLNKVKEYGENNLSQIEKLGQLKATSIYRFYLQCIENLLGHSNFFHYISGLYSDENKIKEDNSNNNYINFLFYYTNVKSIINFINESYDRDLNFYFKADKNDRTFFAQPFYVYAKTRVGLSLTALYNKRDKKFNRLIVRKIKKYIKIICELMKFDFHLYKNKYYILSAELGRIRKKKVVKIPVGVDSKGRFIFNTVDLAKLYDLAIDGARDNNFTTEEAFANEVTGKYYLENNIKRSAGFYFYNSIQCYRNWGCNIKADILEKRYDDIIPKFKNINQQIRSDIDILALDSASQSVLGEIHLEQLLTRLMDVTIKSAGAESGAVILYSKENELEVVARKDKDSVTNLTPVLLDEVHSICKSGINYVVRCSDSLILNEAYKNSSFSRDKYIVDNRVLSLLIMPIKNQGKLLGVLYLENNITSGVFSNDRIAPLKMLSSQIALSIANAKLYEELENNNKSLEIEVTKRTEQLDKANRVLQKSHSEMVKELNLARNIQNEMLPTDEYLKSFDNLDIYARYNSMESLGGDIYDVISIDENRVGIVVADVSGHGVSAALITSFIKASFNKYIKLHKDTAKACFEVNSQISRNLGGTNRFTLTGFIAIIDTEEETIKYTSCAHYPAIVVKSNGDTEMLNTEDMYIGLLPEVTFSVKSNNIHPGDRIVLYTDGVVEAKSASGELYDMDNFVKCLVSGRHLEGDKYIDFVFQSINVFSSGQSADDDRAFLVIDYKGDK